MGEQAYHQEGHRNPTPATDLIIHYVDHQSQRDGIVLVQRGKSPYGIAIPGGHAEWGLSYADNALKEGREETGLTLKLLSDPHYPFTVRSEPDRDPRGHYATVVYVAQGSGVLIPGSHDDAREVRLYTRAELVACIQQHNFIPAGERKRLRAQEPTAPVFAFDDHADILLEYIRSIRWT